MIKDIDYYECSPIRIKKAYWFYESVIGFYTVKAIEFIFGDHDGAL